jgi:nitroreductase
MEFFDVIKKRRAIREYKPKQVSKEDILKILDAANWAPSALDWQPWEFIVAPGEMFKQISYGAPVIIFVLIKNRKSSNERRASLESASAAMENLVLAATDLGLGTCWMTGPLWDEDNLRRELDVQDDLEFVAVTPLGYPDAAPKPQPRKDPELKQKVKWLGNL